MDKENGNGSDRKQIDWGFLGDGQGKPDFATAASNVVKNWIESLPLGNDNKQKLLSLYEKLFKPH